MNTVQILIGTISALAVLGPTVVLAYSLWREAFPNSIIITDRDGRVIGELSAENVQHSDIQKLRELRALIRRNRDEPAF